MRGGGRRAIFQFHFQFPFPAFPYAQCVVTLYMYITACCYFVLMIYISTIVDASNRFYIVTNCDFMCYLCRIVKSFERITENLVDQDNFINIPIQKESLAFWGVRVSFITFCIAQHANSCIQLHFFSQQAKQNKLQENGAMFNLTVLVVAQSLEEIYFGSGSGI